MLEIELTREIYKRVMGDGGVRQRRRQRTRAEETKEATEKEKTKTAKPFKEMKGNQRKEERKLSKERKFIHIRTLKGQQSEWKSESSFSRISMIQYVVCMYSCNCI